MKITASNTQLVQQKVDLINTIVDQPQKLMIEEYLVFLRDLTQG